MSNHPSCVPITESMNQSSKSQVIKGWKPNFKTINFPQAEEGFKLANVPMARMSQSKFTRLKEIQVSET